MKVDNTKTFVDSLTAISIGEVNLCNKYGRKILKYKPYKAKIMQGVWVVYGSLKNGRVGGGPEIKIDQATGNILKISWTR